MMESLPFRLQGSQITPPGAMTTWIGEGSQPAATASDWPGSNVEPERWFHRRNHIFEEILP
jgi:hypothetical protein